MKPKRAPWLLIGVCAGVLALTGCTGPGATGEATQPAPVAVSAPPPVATSDTLVEVDPLDFVDYSLSSGDPDGYAYAFDSPERTINCGIYLPADPSERATGCGVSGATYTRPPDPGCAVSWARSWFLDAELGAEPGCRGGAMFAGEMGEPGMPPVLEDGTALAVGGVRCTSRENVIECRSLETMGGFRVSTAAWAILPPE